VLLVLAQELLIRGTAVRTQSRVLSAAAAVVLVKQAELTVTVSAVTVFRQASQGQPCSTLAVVLAATTARQERAVRVVVLTVELMRMETIRHHREQPTRAVVAAVAVRATVQAVTQTALVMAVAAVAVWSFFAISHRKHLVAVSHRRLAQARQAVRTRSGHSTHRELWWWHNGSLCED